MRWLTVRLAVSGWPTALAADTHGRRQIRGIHLLSVRPPAVTHISEFRRELFAPHRRQLLSAGTVAELRDVWEATGFELERLQAAPHTVAAEQRSLATRSAPQWRLPFTPQWTPDAKLQAADKVTGSFDAQLDARRARS